MGPDRHEEGMYTSTPCLFSLNLCVLQGTPNSVLTSYNRNFTSRVDANPATHIFVTSPDMVMAKIFSQDLGFNPVTDSLKLENGEEFRFQPPTGDSLPANGYELTDYVYSGPTAADRQSVAVQISPSSKRLQRLKAFQPWAGSDFVDCPILIKTVGKCTTDHITAAGPWFQYRGHLENISNNTLIGATNADNKKVNVVRNQISGTEGTVPETARDYQKRGLQWVVVADHNYGEGSSREHAALQPRYLGGVAIIARSFARIHEANLKKQGMLALKFVEESDYDKIKASDRISLLYLNNLAPGKNVIARVTSTEGPLKIWDMELSHTLTSEHIEYFKAGSALNVMASRLGDTSGATVSN